MKSEDFMHEITQTGAIFGRHSNVNVVFEGEDAKTDGNTIYLPALPAGVEFDKATIMAMRGYLDHEAGHIRHSDMAYAQTYGKAVGQECFGLWNSLEDIWMEQRVMNEYPGAEKNLRAIQTSIKQRELDFMEEHKEEFGDNANLANAHNVIAHLGRKDYGDKELNEKALDFTSDRMKTWGGEWLEQLKTCKNSKEVMNLANAIYEQLQKEQQEQESKGEEEQEGGEGQGDALGGMKPGEFKFDPNGDPTKGGKAQDAKEGREGLKPASNDELGDMNKFAKDMLKSESDKFWKDNPDIAKGKVPYKVLTTQYDEVYTKQSKNKRKDYRHELLTKGTIAQYDSIRSGLSGNIHTMKSRLRRALMAKERRDWDTGKEYGKLDSKRLVAGYQGVPTVYKARKDRLEYDTTVMLLVDLSGSMGGSKIQTACQSVIAFSECLEGTNIKFGVYGFDNGGHCGHHFDKIYQEASNSSTAYHRTEPQNILEFKGFSEPLRAAKGSISAIRECSSGNNADRDAVLWAFHKLKQQPSKRKVLMVLSDGQPANDTLNIREYGRGILIKALKEIVQRDKEFGIECVGIGIRDSTVKQIYPKAVSIENVQDLSGTIFTKLSEILLGGGVKL